MNTFAQTTFAECVGRALGRMAKGFVRLDQKTCEWLVAHGLPVGIVKTLLWIIKLVVFGVLLYATFWLALLLTIAVAATLVAWTFEQDESEEWAIGEQTEHKNNPGYDPILYNDAPDPRYDEG